MIKEPIETFKLLLEKYGDDLLYENKVLKKGTYVVVDSDKKSYKVFNIEGENDVLSPSMYKELAKMDYLSSLLTTDKPVDPKKTIHSNNYMSLFIKKDNLSETIINDKSNSRNIYNAINRYFSAIQSLTPDKKSRKSEDKEKIKMYNLLENQLLDIDIEELEKNKLWLENNILKLKEDDNYKEDKNYLKIFFKSPYERFLNECNRYLVPKIYNSNKYNIYVNDVLYGLPRDNMQLNSGKPSLKQMTRKNYCPILLNLEEALTQYKFFSYLENFSVNGENVLYVNDEGFFTYDQIKEEIRSFSGYLLRLKRDTAINLVDFKIIMGYKPRQLNKEFNFENILGLTVYEDSNIEYGIKTSLIEVFDLVDDIIFYKLLKTNMFNDEIRIKSQYLKKIIELTKDNMYSWFYQGKEKEGCMTLKRVSLDILKNSMYQGNFNKAGIQFNFLYSLMLYFENGGKGMPNMVKEIREQMIEKLNLNCNGDKEEIQYIDNDEQYYYSVGQLVKYLISLKNTSKVNQTEINSILNSRNDKRLKDEIERLYKRYNHSKYINNKKLNALYAMILDYKPLNPKQDTTNTLAGFLGISILKNNKNEESSSESN